MEAAASLSASCVSWAEAVSPRRASASLSTDVSGDGLIAEPLQGLHSTLGADVDVVGLARPRQHHVEDLAREPRPRDDGVRGVHSGSLCAVGGGGVGELDVLRDVGGGQCDAGSAGGSLHAQGPVLVSLGDHPGVAVLHPPCPDGEPPVVEPADDSVSDSRLQAVSKGRPLGLDESVDDALRTCPRVERSDGLDVRGQQQGALAARLVGRPGLVGALEDRVEIAVVDPAVGGVGVHGRGIADADAGRRVAFPLLHEPSGSPELGDVLAALAHEESERAAGFDGGQLSPVPDAHQLGSGLAGAGRDPVECERARQRRLVHDDELPGVEAPTFDLADEPLEVPRESGGRGRFWGGVERGPDLVDAPQTVPFGVVLDEPLGGVLGGHAEADGEHVGGRGGRGEADD